MRDNEYIASNDCVASKVENPIDYQVERFQVEPSIDDIIGERLISPQLSEIW